MTKWPASGKVRHVSLSRASRFCPAARSPKWLVVMVRPWPSPRWRHVTDRSTMKLVRHQIVATQ
jgi:hypothetical protein